MGCRQEEESLMAIKLDMERAHELMGWSFLKEALLKFGFHSKFVESDHGVH